MIVTEGVLNFLYAIIISPIESIVDWVFLFIINKIESIGVIGAVLGVSLTINFLALPLYNIADSLQEKERKIAKSLEYRVKRIKKTFKGDERFMMLSEYYRQNGYHPLYVLRSSLSILIEIPFFIAAYQYLSHNELLSGASWWIFNDLGAADEFFSIHLGSYVFGIHILPILMTLINFVSGAIYTKNATFREKAQLYVVAVIFLVLLYNSPSGLVIYWILNNVFSLIKNIVMKTRHPVRIAHVAISIVFFGLAFYVCSHHGSLVKKLVMVAASFGLAAFPAFVTLFRRFASKSKNSNLCGHSISLKTDSLSLLVLSGLGLAFLCGFALPASVVATSPVEFSFLGNTDSPVSYIWSSFFVFFGFFVFWPVAVYKMFGSKVRRVIPSFFFIVFVAVLANVFLFKYPYGNLNVSFTLDDERVLKSFTGFFTILPFLSLIFAVGILVFFARIKKMSILYLIILSVCFAEAGVGILKTSVIKSQFVEHSANVEKFGLAKVNSGNKIEPIYHLSKNGQNVIVLFLDRAISSFFMDLLEESPELKNKFRGFTYYPNTVSFSTNTSLGAPSMMGGYEYTPEAINSRPDELLREKHNESMLVLPKLFADAGFEVTVSDPPWSNYAHEGDLSPFEPYTDIHAYTTFGKYTDLYFDTVGLRGGVAQNNADVICRKEIRNFSVLQALYPPVRSTFYRLCRLNNLRDDRNFYNIFSSLYFLREQTDFSSEKNTYMFIDSDTPHEPHSLTDDYLKISQKIKNYEASHYDVNVAALLQVAKYLDYLRENSVYDNTRIIIVADHGQGLSLKRFGNFSGRVNPAAYNPLLLVKDFGSDLPLKTDFSFMTNADTLFFAKENMPVSDKNPFTNRKFETQKENGVNVYPISNGEHHADHLSKKKLFTLNKSSAYHVSGDITNEENWIPLDSYSER